MVARGSSPPEALRTEPADPTPRSWLGSRLGQGRAAGEGPADAGVTSLSGAALADRPGSWLHPTPVARGLVNGRPGRRWVILNLERRPEPAPGPA